MAIKSTAQIISVLAKPNHLNQQQQQQTNNNLNNNNSIHKSLQTILILAQFFGFLPVHGLTGSDYRSLHFKWISFRLFYSLVLLLGTIFLSSMQFHKMLVKGVDFAEIDRFFFFFCGILSLILFIRLAKCWPNFIRDWHVVEMAMVNNNYGWPRGLNMRLNCLSAGFLSLALGK